MIFLELFSGTKTMSKCFSDVGFESYSVDWNLDLHPTLCSDILDLDSPAIISHIGAYPTVIWASPDCTKFSYASGGKNEFRKKNSVPLSREALTAIELVEHTLLLIEELQPNYWFLENPWHGALKDLPIMKNIPYVDVSYCRYGTENQKLTRIWGKFPPSFIPKTHCHHIKHKIGLKDIAGAKNRSEIPEELGYDIAEKCVLDNGIQMLTLKEFL